MALTYEESDALMRDMIFRGRIKVAILKYATYIAGEPASATAHNSRYKWAQTTFQQPDMQASQIQPPVVMDAAVQADGSAITDEALQTSVEAVVNKLI
jgi:hypothetical protein